MVEQARRRPFGADAQPIRRVDGDQPGVESLRPQQGPQQIGFVFTITAALRDDGIGIAGNAPPP